MKKYLAIILALFLALFLFMPACGGGGGGDDGGSESSNWDQLVWDEDDWG